jgi:hypothetical protein
MKTYGEEKNYHVEPFDVNIFQGQTPACAVKSQEIILRDYGIVIPQDELERFAEANGWYNPDLDTGGTPTNCIGNILEAYGVDVNHSVNNTVFDLVNELSQGHRVIVGVDADELWAETWMEKEEGMIKDFFEQGGNHALIVAGVEVNPNDMNDIKVILTDPGNGDLRVEYDIKDFMDAWQDANCMMVSTTEPAPYQYNGDTQQMEFSQFATDFHPNSNHFINDFDVADFDFNHYNPVFDAGHLEYIEGMSYQDWLDVHFPGFQAEESASYDADSFFNDAASDDISHFYL